MTDSDRESFSELYSRELAAMTGLATIMVGSRRAAEDVVQEAFAKLLPRYDQIDRPGGYLRTSVVNGCYSVLRRRSTEQRALGALDVSVSELPSEFVDLSDALMRLPDRQRAVVVLRYLLDWPDDQIAASLHCTRSTVRSLAARSLRSLRRVLP